MTTEPIRIARFNAGRDLAVEMLREAQDLTLIRRAAVESRERDDPTIPQDRWVVKYLLELQRDPTLLDGFSAVLSDYLSPASGGSADHYARLTATMLTELPHDG
jgi:hypothetical protein